MRRALAVVAAVVMIGLAFVVRSWRAGDDGGDPGRGGGSLAATVVCSTELRTICDQLRAANPGLLVVTEDAGRTYATVTAADFDPAAAKIDGWFAPAPWAEMAAEARQRNGAPPVFTTGAARLARSPLVVVVWNDRLALLRQHCGGDPSWKCIGDAAGRSWSEIAGSGTGGPIVPGQVKPGVSPPHSSGDGVLVAGQASASYFGRTDFASNDFADEGFVSWLSRLAGTANAAASSGGANSTTTPLDRMLFAGPATFDLAGTTEAAASAPVTTGRDKDRLSIIYPSPLATADLLMTTFSASAQREPLEALFASPDAARVIAANGWRTDGSPLPAGARADVVLPDTSGLPRPGVLDALRLRWQEAGR